MTDKIVRIACDTKHSARVEDLCEFQNDLKSLSPENFEKLRNEIVNTGFAFPFLVWGDEKGRINLLDGHQRRRTLLEMQRQGWMIPDLPVVYVEAESYMAAKRRIAQASSSYGLVDRQGMYAFMTDAGLSLPEFEKAFDFPTIDMESFGEEFFKDLAPTIDESKEDEIPESAPARVKRGEIWRLGRHRLACIDSTSAEEVGRLMGGVKADMVFTDPPYGVSYEQGKYTGSTVKKKFAPIANDELRSSDLRAFITQVFTNAKAVAADSCVVYSWSPPLLEGAEILAGLLESGWHIQSQLIWDKKRLVLGRADYQWRHEICWYGYTGKNHFWCGDRDQTSVWEQKRDSNYNHPTQKPVELSERAINNSSGNDGNVLDLFGGSGSTLIACEKTGRTCYMAEIDPLYADVIIERWQQLTGGVARLEGEAAADV